MEAALTRTATISRKQEYLYKYIYVVNEKVWLKLIPLMIIHIVFNYLHSKVPKQS